uniref:Piwi domain-containing protein n=1 Tax=Globodera pallida TaxID=36090 RepID=A0A183CBY4_GLOPA
MNSNGTNGQQKLLDKFKGVSQRDKVHDGCSNAYLFEFRPGSVTYRYDVKITQVGGRWVYTRGGGDPAQRSRAQRINHSIVRKVFEKTAMFGKQAEGGCLYVYDCMSTLYTNVQVDEISLELDAQVFPDELRVLFQKGNLWVDIQACQTEAHVLRLSVEQTSAGASNGDPTLPQSATCSNRSLRTFLELLTSQPFINAGTHFFAGNGELFESVAEKELGDAIALHKGFRKSVMVVSNEGRPTAALFIDVKRCLFFNSVTGGDSVRQVAQRWKGPLGAQFWEKWVGLYQGVRTYLCYKPCRTIIIGGLTQESSREKRLTVDGQLEMSLAEFFRDRKKVTLQHADWPAVIPKAPNEMGVFPLEQISIMANQRVPQLKFNGYLSSQLINANVVTPNLRFQAIENVALQIGHAKGHGEFLKSFGVKMSGRNNVVPLNFHGGAAVRFGEQKTVDTEQGKFDHGRFCKFYRSGELKNWVVGHPSVVEETIVNKFIKSLIESSRHLGFLLPFPQFTIVEISELEQKMGKFAADGKQFFMYIDKKESPSHSPLKLYEQIHRLITQQVTSEVAAVAGQVTLCNIVNKMNMKLFGLNHIPIFEPIAEKRFKLGSGNVLVVGYDASHAPRATTEELAAMRRRGIQATSMEPDVIGFCANYLKEPNNFCGDYFFQPAKQDICHPEHFKSKVSWMLRKLKSKRERPPSIIFIIRDGLDEGKVDNAMSSEIRLFRESCSQISNTWKPKFVYCLADKRHNRRFFEVEGRLPDASQPLNVFNPQPGSAVDRKLIRPDVLNLYVQAHQPVRGTAKIPEFLFPCNEVCATKEELEAFINGLCHSWQIVKAATSLPVPVYQAHELAKRGRANYMELRRMAPERIPRSSDGQVMCEKLSELLSYNDSPLSDTRTTA